MASPVSGDVWHRILRQLSGRGDTSGSGLARSRDGVNVPANRGDLSGVAETRLNRLHSLHGLGPWPGLLCSCRPIATIGLGVCFCRRKTGDRLGSGSESEL